MKHVFVLLLIIFSSSHLNGMLKQSPKKVLCKISRPFKIAPNGCIEIQTNAEKLHIITLPEPPTTLSDQVSTALTALAGRTQLTKKINTLIRGSKNSNLCAVTILALAEITQRIQVPYLANQDETHTHLQIIPHSDLDDLGITLRELIITIPNTVSVIAKSQGPITFETPYAHVDARADEIELSELSHKKTEQYRFFLDQTIGGTEHETRKAPLVILETKNSIEIKRMPLQ